MPALAEPPPRTVDDMGRVTVSVEVANLDDLYRAHRGELPDDDVRRLTIDEALVDTGATMLSLPIDLIQKLGLVELRRKTGQTAAGEREFVVYGVVRMWVQDRDCTVEVLALPEGCPALIGQIPLEYMDWVVDPQRRQLIGNPAHDGEWKLEVF